MDLAEIAICEKFRQIAWKSAAVCDHNLRPAWNMHSTRADATCVCVEVLGMEILQLGRPSSCLSLLAKKDREDDLLDGSVSPFWDRSRSTEMLLKPRFVLGTNPKTEENRG